MALLRALIVTAAVTVFAAACTSADRSPAALSADDYATQLAELMDAPIPEQSFPISASSVQVAGIFLVVEDGLSEMRSLRPPEELEAIHAELLDRFESVQEAVADYLQHHGVEGGDITLDDVFLDAEINPRISAARSSCRELRNQLAALGVPFPAEMCLV